MQMRRKTQVHSPFMLMHHWQKWSEYTFKWLSTEMHALCLNNDVVNWTVLIGYTLTAGETHYKPTTHMEKK